MTDKAALRPRASWRWTALAALPALALFALQAGWPWPFFSDDSFISLRYAARLLAGEGLTWTDGERVEGYSNLLWVLLTAGEKTGAARQITVHGTPGHGSMPYATDNALMKAAEIVRRVQQAELEPHIDDMFRDRVKALGLTPEQQKGLLDPGLIKETLASLPPGLARNTHSCCHTTISPNMMTAGDKLNTIAHKATLALDIRMMPGQTQQEIDDLLVEIIGPDLMPDCEITPLLPNMQDAAQPTTTDTPLWDAMVDSIQIAYPNARVVPSLVTGGTDARFFRRKGTAAYGAGLLSNQVSVEEFLNRFHGHNERIDTESLKLTTQLWLDVCDRLWARAAS